jgi:hypothetical protein
LRKIGITGNFVFVFRSSGAKMDWTIERVDGLASSAKASATRETGRILFARGGSAQPIEKAQNGQGNTRKSKPFPLIFFAGAWADLAGFG